MWKIDDRTGKITMTRGDTPFFKVSAMIEDEEGNLVEYEPEEDDKIIFAVKQSKYDRDYLFYKEIPHDTMTLQLEESDTVNLELGKYIYEVSLNKDSYHCTFIAEKRLVLTTDIY